MLCAKYVKILCYVAKHRNIMCKMQKRYAQNLEMLCSKFRNVMLKMQNRYAQNAETLCSKFRKTLFSKRGKVMLIIQKCYAQNAGTLCSQCGDVTVFALIYETAKNNCCIGDHSGLIRMC